MQKLFTTKDLPDFVKSMTGEDITERTARNWLEGLPAATTQKKPKQYDLDTIMEAIHSNMKRILQSLLNIGNPSSFHCVHLSNKYVNPHLKMPFHEIDLIKY